MAQTYTAVTNDDGTITLTPIVDEPPELMVVSMPMEVTLTVDPATRLVTQAVVHTPNVAHLGQVAHRIKVLTHCLRDTIRDDAQRHLAIDIASNDDQWPAPEWEA